MWRGTKRVLSQKDFTQKEGIDYKKTFSLVSSKESFKIIMALAAHFDLKLYQMDVKTTLLNGDIDGTIYMVQLENIVSETQRTSFTNLKNPFMDSNKHLDNSISSFIK